MTYSARFQEVYQQLAADIQHDFDCWCQAIIQTEQRGSDIVSNIKLEHHLDQNTFAKFITEIARFYNNETTARQAYEQACNEFYKSGGIDDVFCQGSLSDVRFDTVLYRIIKLKYLKRLISEAMGKTGSRRDNRQEAWDDFRNYMQTNDPYFCEILNGVRPGTPDRLIWAYHGEQAESNDPLADLTADDHLDQLGLPSEWEYERGLTEHEDNSPWKIRYCPSLQRERYIPTIADTLPDWNPYFQPTQDLESPRYGWTRPIDSPRGSQGVPETVHLGWDQGEEPGCVQHIEFPGGEIIITA